MTHVIVVNGPPRAGKDTFIEMVTEALKAMDVPVASFSSIDPVREMFTSAGIDLSEKTEADRLLLSVVGDALETHGNWRTKACVNNIETFRNANFGRGVFFLHIREPQNIEVVRGLCEMTLNRVKFTTVYLDSIRAEKITSNASDAGVMNMPYDQVIYNNGGKDVLRKVALRFAHEVAA
jgi:hypothetical protein